MKTIAYCSSCCLLYSLTACQQTNTKVLYNNILSNIDPSREQFLLFPDTVLRDVGVQGGGGQLGGVVVHIQQHHNHLHRVPVP
jgi:hypothetical protein